MRIKNIRHIRQSPSPNGFLTLLKFNYEPCEGVLIYDCCLVRKPDGRHLFYGPPSKHCDSVISLAPEIRHALVEMALNEIGNDNHESSQAA